MAWLRLVRAARNWIDDTITIHITRLTAEFGDQTGAACKDMLGDNLAVPDGPELVDVSRLTLRAALDDPLAGIVIFAGDRLAVVGDRLDAVFLPPYDSQKSSIFHVIY